METAQPIEETKLEPIEIRDTDVVTVTNPTTEDFYFTMGHTELSMGPNSREATHTQSRYVVPAGKWVKMEGFKARFYIRKMVDKLILDNERPQAITIDEIRLPYEHQVFIGKESGMLESVGESRPSAISEEPKIQKEEEAFPTLNKKSSK